MSEATPRPWKAEKRNWRNEPSEHDWYIRGDIREPDDLDEIGSATSVAIVVGNATSGDIAKDTAELIVKAVNAHDDLVCALARIEKWFGEFPPSGSFWRDKTPMSYEAAFGSNGERDFMRAIAREALAKVEAAKQQPNHATEADVTHDFRPEPRSGK